VNSPAFREKVTISGHGRHVNKSTTNRPERSIGEGSYEPNLLSAYLDLLKRIKEPQDDIAAARLFWSWLVRPQPATIRVINALQLLDSPGAHRKRRQLDDAGDRFLAIQLLFGTAPW
jgi:hypothetical protein